MALTEQQNAFFETFGFLVFPGLVSHDLDWINAGFEEIFAALPQKHDGTRRTIAGTDTSERLCRLLDHPKVLEVAASLLGDDFNYLGGDANYYVGDSGWHSDGWHDCGRYVKMECRNLLLTRPFSRKGVRKGARKGAPKRPEPT